MDIETCRLCGHSARQLLDAGCHPISHQLLERADQTVKTYPFVLLGCPTCAFVQLKPSIPSQELYNNYYLSSWKPQPHVEPLIQRIGQFCAGDARIVELGCNDGGFLKALAEAGYNNILGIEPAADASRAAQQAGLPTINAYFDESLASRLVDESGQADLVVTRQVLEHIDDLRGFCQALSRLLKVGGTALIEVPDFDFCLESLDYSCFWEEHVNYFSLATLTSLLGLFGLRVFHHESFLFTGKALVVLARKEGREGQASSEHQEWHKIERFAGLWPVFCTTLKETLRQARSAGPLHLYGAGCRAFALLNFAGLSDQFDCVLDDLPIKLGKFVPGCALPIVSSSKLQDPAAAGLCLLAVNSENEEKVMVRHARFKENGGRFASCLPPSPRLLPEWTHLMSQGL